MEAVILTKDQYHSILDALNEIKSRLIQNTKKPEDSFIDNGEFLQLMKISKRTSQVWRDTGVIAFSQIGNKIYYKLSDVEELLKNNHRSSFNKSFYKRQ